MKGYSDAMKEEYKAIQHSSIVYKKDNLENQIGQNIFIKTIWKNLAERNRLKKETKTKSAKTNRQKKIGLNTLAK